jgi:hypothetical protein
MISNSRILSWWATTRIRRSRRRLRCENWINASRFRRNLAVSIILLVIIAALIIVYLAKPLPPPNVSIEFQGFESKDPRVFDLVAGTNEDGQFYYGSTDSWLSCLPSSDRFPTRQTNFLCILYFTNRGPTRVWWTPVDCEVEARTPNGWITNVFGHFTTMPGSMASSGKDVFKIYVPTDAIEWKVSGWYGYYPRHSPRQEFAAWLLDDEKYNPTRSPKFYEYLIMPFAWGLGLVPEPEGKDAQIFSDLFTNKPPLN